MSIPAPGEVEHIVRFQTLDSNGYIHSGEFSFIYGNYQRDDGIVKDVRQAPVQARLVVYKTNVANDPNNIFGSSVEYDSGTVPTI